MNKAFDNRFFLTLGVAAVCLWLIWPTIQYFTLVNQMGGSPTVEQVAERDRMLEESSVIPLGLDLQGGAEFLLTVDKDLLRRRSLEKKSQSLRTIFARDDVPATISYEVEAEGDGQVDLTIVNSEDIDIATLILDEELTRIGLSAAGDIRSDLEDGSISLYPDTSEDAEIIQNSIEGALKVLKKRINEFGLTQPEIGRVGDDRIRVAIPGENDPERIRESLLKTASLEFRMVHPNSTTLLPNFIENGAFIQNEAGDPLGTGIIKDEFMEERVDPRTQKLTKVLSADIPGVPDGYVIRLGREVFIDPGTGMEIPEKSIDNLVYILKAEAPLTGQDLSRAYSFTNPQDLQNPIQVGIEFNSHGAETFAQLTRDNVEQRFAILLDDIVYSAPVINEPITGGSATIRGGFTQASARDLSVVLKAGALPAPLVPIRENTVGASLGAESIRDSARALMYGGAFLVLLMLFVYRSAGVVALCAMTLNIMMILAMLALMGATLTLSGIGGILLTMGMAVDANVLIYERLREELESGKPLRGAINAAFGRAASVIVDANVTTLLPALMLVLFEVVEGSVKGFWLALAIGLLANLFTGLFVTRTLFESWYAMFKKIGVGPRLIKAPKFEWLKYRFVGVGFSLAITVVALGYLGVKGPNLGIDFTGGVLSIVEVTDENASQSDIVDLFDEDFPDVRVVRVMNKDQWQLTLPQTINPETGEDYELTEMNAMIEQAFASAYPGEFEIESSESMEALVGNEFAWTAVWMVFWSSIIILAYIAMRFQWVFGAGALLALFHDVFLSLGVFKLLGHSLTLDIVSALLIILGYSVNDTIVVFDRIREKMEEHVSHSLYDIMNAAINETLSRTIFTSGTTFIAVLSMFLFGGSGLTDFALILLLGIFFGTYSSIFIAGSLVYYMLNSKGGRPKMQNKKAQARIAPQKMTTG